jgi:hypothetical protein
MTDRPPTPQPRLIERTTPKQGDGEPAAQRSKRRRREITYRRMPARREVLEVLQNAGVDPMGADDLHAASAGCVTQHRDRSRPGVGDEMLEWAGEPRSHRIELRHQEQEPAPTPGPQRENCEKNDAAPC